MTSREPGPSRDRVPVSEEHRRLGGILREARIEAGATTRDVALYSSGHISNVENGHTMPSTELVYYYVTEFGCDEHLARRALDQARKVTEERRRTQRLNQRQQNRHSVPFTVTPDASADTIRQGYEVRETEAYYHIDGRGVITEVDVIRSVVPLYPGVSLVSAAYNYHRDTGTGVLTIEPGIGCSVAAVRETGFGYLSAVLQLDRELDPREGEPFSFSYRVLVRSSIPARPMLRYRARPGSRRYALRVRFTPPALPKAAWWFRERDVFETEGAAPLKSDHLFPSNSNGFYFRDFLDVDKWHTGITWEWQDDMHGRE
ncbi:helix-turn-helix transcriptional regulator [Streptomonospora sp. PA3]|uniref:helix-turn-helix domain-containing protein n=1 Tax=Streptomonospora sp. PA3 TaxID=2607326 RepID=UPI0012DC8C23|nr:helix-turn-helix transcriptional regulator [Streptomonospora sp. PA3]MUL42076.1 helix-turn-helix transcriptional regulator [Streptomonospora sp. PA3]